MCKPVIGVGDTGNGFRQIMYDRSVCTGDADEIDDSLESFPSGHSTAAFAGFVFLALYLNAKLKVWADYHPAMWKLVAVYAPVLGATLIAGALTIDEYHNWYDCVAGAVIGTVMAFSSYRMVYASIWDWRINHIPLTRAVPFTGSESQLSHAAFTHQAGWGMRNGGHLNAVDGGGQAVHHGGFGNGNGSGIGTGASMTRKPVGGHVHRSDNIV